MISRLDPSTAKMANHVDGATPLSYVRTSTRIVRVRGPRTCALVSDRWKKTRVANSSSDKCNGAAKFLM